MHYFERIRFYFGVLGRRKSLLDLIIEEFCEGPKIVCSVILFKSGFICILRKALVDVQDWNLEFLGVVKIVRDQKVVSYHQGLYLHLGPVRSLAASLAAHELDSWNIQPIKFDPNRDYTKANQELLQKLEQRFGLNSLKSVQHVDCNFGVDFVVDKLGAHVVFELFFLDKVEYVCQTLRLLPDKLLRYLKQLFQYLQVGVACVAN